MRFKRLAALTLGMTVALTMTAWANESDAVAVYQEMKAKESMMTDMDAYIDVKEEVSVGGKTMDIRMEMNVKINNLRTPDQMRMNTYMRLTLPGGGIPGGASGPGEAVQADDPAGSQFTGNLYYADGMYYMDMAGQKIKVPIPLDAIMASAKQSTGTVADSLDSVRNLKLRMEGENRVLSFNMDEVRMNGLLDQVMARLKSITGNSSLSYRDIYCEYIVNPEGYCIKNRMKMTIDMTIGKETVVLNLDGDVGYADPGQPVTITAPDLTGYTLAQ